MRSVYVYMEELSVYSNAVKKLASFQRNFLSLFLMPVLKRKLSNPFNNMNGNNSNRAASRPGMSAETEQLACLLVCPGEERLRKNSAPSGAISSMSAIVERRTARSPRFNLGGGKNRTDSPSAGKKRKERQASFDSKKTALDKIDVEILKKWEVSFSSMLESADGLELFEEFLKSEFSDENIHFWKTCERFKTLPEHKLEKEAVAIFEEYIAPRAPKMVNIDYQTTQEVKENMKRPNRETFSKAQQSIYLLMARDSFVRFVKAEPFQQALKR